MTTAFTFHFLTALIVSLITGLASGFTTTPYHPKKYALLHHQRTRVASADGIPEAEADGNRVATNNQIYSGSSSTENSVDKSIPTNLRRKISAKRPPLGHVAPKMVRKRQPGMTETAAPVATVTGGSNDPRLRPQGKAREAGLNNPSMLRISAGTAKGRRLDSPSVYLRPMMGKVREAVFSTLTSFGLYQPTGGVGEWSSTRHWDLFAGSGSVGLESLSRGAAHCTFVDLSPDCCDAIRRNVALCRFDEDLEDNESNLKMRSSSSSRTGSTGPSDRVQIVTADALRALRFPDQVGIPKGRTFQVVTMCPPYEEVVYGDLLEAVVQSPAVSDDTVVLVEYPVELGCLPHVIQSSSESQGRVMVGVRNRRYGRTVVAMYVINPTGRLTSAESRPEEFVSLSR